MKKVCVETFPLTDAEEKAELALQAKMAQEAAMKNKKSITPTDSRRRGLGKDSSFADTFQA